VSRLADSSYLRRGIWPANFRVVDKSEVIQIGTCDR
jgi:hypothetical protein